MFEESTFNTMDIIHRCKFLLMELVANNELKHQILQCTHPSEQSWIAPEPDCIRVDVDGSVQHNYRAACEGVLRNHRGD